jgi:hypothetical protein
MKQLMVSLFAVISISGVARAGPIVVLEVPVDADQKVEAKFDFDSDLGRAWVDVEENDFRYEKSENTVRARVEGLYYDAKVKQIIYRSGDRPIVCAKESNILGIGTLYPTGNCPLAVTFEDRILDDGFHADKQTFVKVTLNPGP